MTATLTPTRAARTAVRAAYNAAGWLDQAAARVSAPDMLPALHVSHRYRQILAPTYHDYVSRVSWADHAVSLETAAVLLQLCEQRRPSRVLDTGSGYSSYVLRRYAAEHGAEVVSVETDPTWMDRTAEYLTEAGVGTEGLLSWDDFRSRDQGTFGLVFHDMASGTLREQSMSTVTRCTARDGVLVLDDMQHTPHRRQAKLVTAAAGRRYISLRQVTLDAIGRYASVSVL